jgi:hypothetical protein
MHNEDELWTPAGSTSSNTNYFTHFQAPATPHEPLSLDWTDLELSLSSDVLALSGQQDAAEGTEEASDEGTADTRPASPGPLEMTPVMNEVLPDLPPLPPLDVLPTLPMEVFHRPIPAPSKPSKKITPTPAAIVPPPAPTAASRKRSATAATASASVPSVASGASGKVSKASASAPPPHPPPRKKRRGQRAGTYQCMVDGELYDCPFHYDMVPKSLILSLLTR